jgi:xylan 1,4-beta-xylosidase
LLNQQGIAKSAFYAYEYLNKLGNIELTNTDSRSWACKDEKGNVQVLFWDFTNTHPGDSVNNQVYYIQNLPPKTKGKVKVSLSDVPEGTYALEISKVGYHVNDAYTTYLELGKPAQLTQKQVNEIRSINNGMPVSTEIVKINANKGFSKELDLRENDVLLLNLRKL